MKRYVIKKDNQWSVVNANYKRILKSFKTQKEAIKYAESLDSTTSIILQGDDNKFRKITGWDTSETKTKVVKYVPLYIYKNTDEGVHKSKIKEYVLISAIAAFTVTAIVFFTLFGLEY